MLPQTSFLVSMALAVPRHPPDALKVLRANLARLLKARGARARLAEALHVSPPSVTNWVNGGHGLEMDKLGPIAQALGLKLPDLFRQPDMPESEEQGEQWDAVARKAVEAGVLEARAALEELFTVEHELRGLLVRIVRIQRVCGRALQLDLRTGTSQPGSVPVRQRTRKSPA